MLASHRYSYTKGYNNTTDRCSATKVVRTSQCNNAYTATSQQKLYVSRGISYYFVYNDGWCVHASATKHVFTVTQERSHLHILHDVIDWTE